MPPSNPVVIIGVIRNEDYRRKGGKNADIGRLWWTLVDQVEFSKTVILVYLGILWYTRAIEKADFDVLCCTSMYFDQFKSCVNPFLHLLSAAFIPTCKRRFR